MYANTHAREQQIDKGAVLKAFNTHFFEFIDAMIEIFPENRHLRTARNSFDMLKKANSTCIIKVWNTYVYTPYKVEIEFGDIDFFVLKDYSHDLANLSNASRVLAIVDQIREPVRNMGDRNKQHTVKYIQNLSRLSAAYGGF